MKAVLLIITGACLGAVALAAILAYPELMPDRVMRLAAH